MSNHFHLLLVVDNPEHVSGFVGYVKGELAHVVNRLLGRRQRTIWQDGYDSPLILTYEDVLKYIRYIYINPIKANLVARIEDYPGVSSWRRFISDKLVVSHKKISRSLIKPLSYPAIPINEQRRLVDYYEGEPGNSYQFTLEPFAWLKCFPAFENEDVNILKQEIINSIREEEQKLRDIRVRERKSVIGATTLRRQSMLKEHTPKKYSRRMICISYNKELRQRMIVHFRALCDEASNTYREWKLGNLLRKIPAGLFSPRIPNLCSAMPIIY